MLIGTDLTTRLNTPDDDAYVLSTWIKSYGQSLEAQRFAMSTGRNHWYVSRLRPLVEMLYRAHGATMVVDPDEPSSLMGYMVHDARAVHYVYVAYPCRRMGIATELLQSAGLPSPIPITFLWPYVSDRYSFRPEFALKKPNDQTGQ